MELMFYNLNTNQKCYLKKYITSLTFLFNDNYYYTGFVKKIERVGEYEFQKKYAIEIFFPSINQEDEEDLNLKDADKKLLKICAGRKIIGEAYIMGYQFDDKS